MFAPGVSNTSSIQCSPLRPGQKIMDTMGTDDSRDAGKLQDIRTDAADGLNG